MTKVKTLGLAAAAATAGWAVWHYAPGQSKANAAARARRARTAARDRVTAFAQVRRASEPAWSLAADRPAQAAPHLGTQRLAADDAPQGS